ncbi:LysR substrate-binding domain-containing protein [Candidatus Halobeggiatoa sp. HSG11]|nr:LysR substrate-binding domain-containing protein [Candidatus Halobeggiatoa sp. HSG11]
MYLHIAGRTLLEEGRDLLSLANNVERNVQQVIDGWEAELRIAVSDLITDKQILAICQEFYQVQTNTELRIVTEVLAGTWDALFSNRVDLIIGAPSRAMSGGSYTLHAMGKARFIFTVAKHHPLATVSEPLSNSVIRKYRAVVAADSSRNLPALSYGLLPGQPIFTVPNILMKIEAQRMGLGVGHLPKHMIINDIANGNLVVKTTEDDIGELPIHYYAWRTNNKGKALEWFKQRLCKESIDWFG